MEISKACKALGDPTRLRIYEQLVSCCCPVAVAEDGSVSTVEGPSVGEVCCSVTGAQQITSTVSFHLDKLRQAGLITLERRGKRMICGVELSALNELAEFFGTRRAQLCACDGTCECASGKACAVCAGR